MTMSATVDTISTIKYISVTIDFLKALNPDWDVENNNRHLFAALRAVGINPNKKLDIMEDKYVRYVHAPLYSRKTTIYQGQMVDNYPFAAMYNNVEILDVNIKNDANVQVVVDFLVKAEDKKLVQDFDFDEGNSYVGSEGNRDLKNGYMTKKEKKSYKVINMHDKQLEEVLESENIYSSPFDAEDE